MIKQRGGDARGIENDYREVATVGMWYGTRCLYSKRDWVGQTKSIQKENIALTRLDELKEIKSRREFLPSEEVEYKTITGSGLD